MDKKKRIIIAISGASGSIYGIRLLEILKEHDIETHLVVSNAGHITIKHETNYKIEEVISLANYHYDIADIGAAISSGSFKTIGMIIAPCSMKTLASIAYSFEDNLISRAASVTLKDKRKLILMPRESLLHSGHLENMLKISNYGGIIAPPIPAFYTKPKAIDDLINHSVSRVLDFFDIDSGLINRWEGI